MRENSNPNSFPSINVGLCDISNVMPHFNEGSFYMYVVMYYLVTRNLLLTGVQPYSHTTAASMDVIKLNKHNQLDDESITALFRTAVCEDLVMYGVVTIRPFSV